MLKLETLTLILFGVFCLFAGYPVVHTLDVNKTALNTKQD